MSDRPSSFIERSVAGQAGLHEIDDCVDAWHESDGNVALHDFLGMTLDEYALWVADPDALAMIVRARREHIALFDAVK